MRREKCRRFLALLLILPALMMLAAGCGAVEKSLYPKEYNEIVEPAAREDGLEAALVYAVIKAESNFREDAVSAAGAIGLMQITPETFEWLLMRQGYPDLTVDDLADPVVNISYGCHLLAYLRTKYTDLKTIAAAYNAGFGAVDGWLEDPAYSSDGVHLENIPYGETAAYAEKVVKNYEKYKELYQ